jgi:hypothetical protein
MIHALSTFLSPKLVSGEFPETQVLLCEYAIDLPRQFLQALWVFLDSGMDAHFQPALFSRVLHGGQGEGMQILY